MLLLVSGALERGWRRGDRRGCSPRVAAFGMFSQLTMAAPVALLALWVYLERRSRVGRRRVLRQDARLMGPALAATAASSCSCSPPRRPARPACGSAATCPFDVDRLRSALDDLSAGRSAFRDRRAGSVRCSSRRAVRAGLAPAGWLGSRARLYALLILGVPVAVALLHPGNAAFARYYLSSALGLLLLVAEWIGRGLAGRRRCAWSAPALATVAVRRALARPRSDPAGTRPSRRSACRHGRCSSPRARGRARAGAAHGDRRRGRRARPAMTLISSTAARLPSSSLAARPRFAGPRERSSAAAFRCARSARDQVRR